MNEILKVDKIFISYGAVKAVTDVSFFVREGEIFGLLGPNGAGKTSTLSAIEGLLEPDGGTISIAGYNLKKNPLLAKAHMGVQLQSTNFQPELTVSQIL